MCGTGTKGAVATPTDSGCGSEDSSDGQTSKQPRTFTRAQVATHNSKTDKWIIIDNRVYDITRFATRHPGGFKVISHYAGEDASDAFHAFHIHEDRSRKYMAALYKGDIEDVVESSIQHDFRKLRATAERTGLFKASPFFFALCLGHIVALEILGYWILAAYGVSVSTVLISALVLTTMQAQAGWHQHDLGHLSVFPQSTWNHWVHKFVIGVTKAASADWWNHRHFQHHAKPNVVQKDPDITFPYMFVVGEKMAKLWGEKKRGFMRYNWQQVYFFLTFPPLLLPIYFHYENIYFVIKKRRYSDLIATGLFFAKHFLMYGPLMGGWNAFWFYMFVRFLESHWFTWVTQMNHIPMEVDKEQNRDWVSMQLAATCNVEGSFFNDWFTGHLNYQIEHHLFPTMPRHNYSKVAPLVKSLCNKHGIQYQTKGLMEAFADVVKSLKVSGEIWLEAYNLS